MTDIMNISKYKLRRKELRNHSTATESALWRMLKGSQVCNLKFRRKHGVGPYILDFYCPSIKLAIELDGEVHKGQEFHDEQRSYYLSEVAQIVVMRFENLLVFENPKVIFDSIKEYIRQIE